ncbi:hypothetical protein I4U23_000660 [Adineta vaga]|nr:hypothetical protein I4U23_000660 [Adineta vaga]
MYGYRSETITRLTSSIALGGLLCFGIVLFLIASTIVLSLISIYIPNHSEEGYGEHYQIKAILLKALYQNISSTLQNGTIVDSVILSNLCASTYRNHGEKNFLGCFANNFYTFDAYNTSTTSRRRRRLADASLYEIGEINLYYSNSCPSRNHKSIDTIFTKFNNCIQRRLIACDHFKNSDSQSTDWTSSSGHVSQTILTSNHNSYQYIIVEKLYGLSLSTAIPLADSLKLPSTMKTDLKLSCQYKGSLPQEEINAILSSQTISTTESPSSTYFS